MRVVNIKPRRGARILIGAIPIATLLIVYAIFSAARLEANPNDKVLPTFAAMAEDQPQVEGGNGEGLARAGTGLDQTAAMQGKGQRQGALWRDHAASSSKAWGWLSSSG